MSALWSGREHSAVVIDGPAGAGKTTLARFWVAEHRSRTSSLHLLCTPATRPVPLGAIYPVLEAAPADETTALTIARAYRILSRARTGSSSIILVDDAQYLDDLSAALILRVILEEAAFVIFTLRTGERYSDSLARILSETSVGIVHLRPLGVADVAQYLDAVVGPVASGVDRHFARLSGGNALYLRELVAGALEYGALREGDHGWFLASTHVQSTDVLTHVFDVRMRSLSAPSREAARRIAEAGELSLDLASHAFPAGVLTELARRDVVEVQRTRHGRMVRVAHPLLAEAILADLSEIARSDLRAELADLIEEFGDGTEAAFLSTVRLRLSSTRPPAVDIVARAFDLADEAGDLALQLSCARHLWSRSRDADSALRLAASLLAQRSTDSIIEAESVLEEAMRRTRAEDTRYVELLMLRAQNMAEGLYKADEAEALVRSTRYADSRGGSADPDQFQLARAAWRSIPGIRRSRSRTCADSSSSRTRRGLLSTSRRSFTPVGTATCCQLLTVRRLITFRP